MPHSPPGDQGRLAFPHLRLLRRTAVVTAETVARPVSAPWNQLAGQDQLSRPLWDSASDLSPQERDVLRATLDDRDGPMAVLPLWVALGSCLAARGHVTGNGDTQTPPAHSPCSERTLTQAEARPCPPCLPGPLSPTKPHWVPLRDRLERTKYLSVHMPVVRIEKLARDQEWPDARILACSQNQAHGATLQGSERNEDRHDTDGSSWSCKTARA